MYTFNIFTPSLDGHSVFFILVDGIFSRMDLASRDFLYLVLWWHRYPL